MEIDKLSGTGTYFNNWSHYQIYGLATLATAALAGALYLKYIRPIAQTQPAKPLNATVGPPSEQVAEKKGGQPPPKRKYDLSKMVKSATAAPIATAAPTERKGPLVDLSKLISPLAQEPAPSPTIKELPKPQQSVFGLKEVPSFGRTLDSTKKKGPQEGEKIAPKNTPMRQQEVFFGPKTPAAIKSANLVAMENITPETMRAEGKALLLSTLKTNQEKANLHVVLADHLFSLEKYDDASFEITEGYQVLGNEVCPVSLLLERMATKRDLINAAREESLLDNSKILKVFDHLDVFKGRKENTKTSPILDFKKIIGYLELRNILPTPEQRALLYYILAANLMSAGIHDLAECANRYGLLNASLIEQGASQEIVHKLQMQCVICKHFQETEKKVAEELVTLQEQLKSRDMAQIVALQAEIERLKLQIQERENPQQGNSQVVLGEELLAKLREEIRVGLQDLKKQMKEGGGLGFVTPTKEGAGPPPPPPPAAPPPPDFGKPSTPMNMGKLIASRKAAKNGGEAPKTEEVKEEKATDPKRIPLSDDALISGRSALKSGKERKVRILPPKEGPKNELAAIKLGSRPRSHSTAAIVTPKGEATPVEGNAFKRLARQSQRAKKDAEALVDDIFAKEFAPRKKTDSAVNDNNAVKAEPTNEVLAQIEDDPHTPAKMPGTKDARIRTPGPTPSKTKDGHNEVL